MGGNFFVAHFTSTKSPTANSALANMAGRRKNNQQHISIQLRFRQTNNAEQQNKQ
jgi:hypothetical protein